MHLCHFISNHIKISLLPTVLLSDLNKKMLMLCPLKMENCFKS